MEAVDSKLAVRKLVGQTLDLIVCEATLPNRYCLRFMGHVKGTSASSSTPVIALTTASLAEKKPKAGPPAPAPGSPSRSSRRR